ncbi:hypothetical protein N3K66_005199 [Trichothecium roseum]|uniref:Uncharacterized protein n=1 Tax=Trichothecium roseum TaxID=47278 RepID=A0ACC0V3I6_9HYPO|nr:hypothetical protein N3K66_005199 [Trichothecium roseum]
MAREASPELGDSPPIKKKVKKEKKRAREEDAVADAGRTSKKSKKHDEDVPVREVENLTLNGDAKPEKKKKKNKKKDAEEVPDEEPVTEVNGGDDKVEKKKKKKKQKEAEVEVKAETPAPAPAPVAAAAEVVEDEKKEKKKKKSKKVKEEDSSQPAVEEIPAVPKTKEKKKKSKKQAPTAETKPDPEAMDIDTHTKAAKSSPTAAAHAPSDCPSDPQYPFFTQTVSLREALYPNGWDAPVTTCSTHYLGQLHNRYVPHLRGVLLDYSNVCLGDKPGRAGAAASDDEAAAVVSKAEFAGAFGWITADVKLFVPTRGAWMEGSVNLQTEGHIGVVCFGKFNASVEARRLPSDWTWVPNEDVPAEDEETATVVTADEHGVSHQIHSTGFWADSAGAKVRGKVRFRIRNFDVGVSGDATYLSLQGTMLDAQSEKQLVKTEAEEARARKGGKSRDPLRRRVPQFSMTMFDDGSAKEEEEPEPQPEPVLVTEREAALEDKSELDPPQADPFESESE